MSVSELESTAGLRRVNKQMRRRVVKLKFGESKVQITFAGGMYKARYEGEPDVAFGIDPGQARTRLRSIPNMIRHVIPKDYDVALDRSERGNRA